LREEIAAADALARALRADVERVTAERDSFRRRLRGMTGVVEP
jgi:hypothetical protein